MVVGGLATMENMTQAIEWLLSKLKALGSAAPEDVYSKGEDFTGILFARFRGIEDRDAALRRLRDKSSRDSGHEHWVKPDLPLVVRTVQSFLFGAKYLFAQWGYARAALWVDLDTNKFYVGDSEVVQAVVNGGKFEVTIASDWKNELDDPDWKQLVETAKTKLAATKGKGTEKGKGKQPLL